MKKNNRNIRVCAVNNGNRDGFNIYLIYHRHNGLLYDLLKDGVAIDDVRRWTPASLGCFHVGRTGSSGLYEVTKHLVSVINDYMLEREAC